MGKWALMTFESNSQVVSWNPARRISQLCFFDIVGSNNCHYKNHFPWHSSSSQGGRRSWSYCKFCVPLEQRDLHTSWNHNLGLYQGNLRDKLKLHHEVFYQVVKRNIDFEASQGCSGIYGLLQFHVNDTPNIYNHNSFKHPMNPFFLLK